MRLGGSANLAEPFPKKPRGMHRMTYYRWLHKAMAAQERSIALELEYMRRHYPGLLSRETVAERRKAGSKPRPLRAPAACVSLAGPWRGPAGSPPAIPEFFAFVIEPGISWRCGIASSRSWHDPSPMIRKRAIAVALGLRIARAECGTQVLRCCSSVGTVAVAGWAGLRTGRKYGDLRNERGWIRRWRRGGRRLRRVRCWLGYRGGRGRVAVGPCWRELLHGRALRQWPCLIDRRGLIEGRTRQGIHCSQMRNERDLAVPLRAAPIDV